MLNTSSQIQNQKVHYLVHKSILVLDPECSAQLVPKPSLGLSFRHLSTDNITRAHFFQVRLTIVVSVFQLLVWKRFP
jgi:hypothetical protein